MDLPSGDHMAPPVFTSCWPGRVTLPDPSTLTIRISSFGCASSWWSYAIPVPSGDQRGIQSTVPGSAAEPREITLAGPVRSDNEEVRLIRDHGEERKELAARLPLDRREAGERRTADSHMRYATDVGPVCLHDVDASVAAEGIRSSGERDLAPPKAS